VNKSELTALLDRSESETLDFKRKQPEFSKANEEEKGELLKDIVSMANAKKDADAHIVIGVDEENGRAKRICGAVVAIADAEVQQFVNSNTNRPVLFRVEVLQHEGATLTIIQIDRAQARPIFLKKDVGKLKKDIVYIRRGSSTTQASPDEIADMGRDENAAQLKQERVDLFWKTFKVFLTAVYDKIYWLKNLGWNDIYDTTIIEHRLPLAEADNFLKQASEIDLGQEFYGQLVKLVGEIRDVNEYMNFGAEELNKLKSNFHGKKESLFKLVSEMKQQYLK
jgi:hypothetical protein